MCAMAGSAVSEVVLVLREGLGKEKRYEGGSSL